MHGMRLWLTLVIKITEQGKLFFVKPKSSEYYFIAQSFQTSQITHRSRRIPPQHTFPIWKNIREALSANTVRLWEWLCLPPNKDKTAARGNPSPMPQTGGFAPKTAHCAGGTHLAKWNKDVVCTSTHSAIMCAHFSPYMQMWQHFSPDWR